MPTTGEDHRAKIGLFQPVLMKILINKMKIMKQQRKSDKYSPFCKWDLFTDLSYRCLVTTFCMLVFVVYFKLTISLLTNECFQDKIHQFFNGDMINELKRNRYNYDRTITLPSFSSMLMRTDSNPTFMISSERLVDCEQWYVNPFYTLSLVLSNDVEENPGPTTEDLIKELGVTLTERLDLLSGEISSLKTTSSSVSDQLADIAIQLREKEEKITVVENKISELEDRIDQIEKRLERHEIMNRRNNIIFYGIKERTNKWQNEEERTDMLLRLLNDHDTSQLWTKDNITSVHRIGKLEQGQTRPRPLIATMTTNRDKHSLISKKTLREKLGRTGIKMNDDLTHQQRTTLKDVRDEGLIAFYRGSRLVVKRKESSDKNPRQAEDTFQDSYPPLTKRRQQYINSGINEKDKCTVEPESDLLTVQQHWRLNRKENRADDCKHSHVSSHHYQQSYRRSQRRPSPSLPRHQKQSSDNKRKHHTPSPRSPRRRQQSTIQQKENYRENTARRGLSPLNPRRQRLRNGKEQKSRSPSPMFSLSPASPYELRTSCDNQMRVAEQTSSPISPGVQSCYAENNQPAFMQNDMKDNVNNEEAQVYPTSHIAPQPQSSGRGRGRRNAEISGGSNKPRGFGRGKGHGDMTSNIGASPPLSGDVVNRPRTRQQTNSVQSSDAPATIQQSQGRIDLMFQAQHQC